MDPTAAYVSAKVINTTPEKGTVQQLFALVHWHEDCRRFDIYLTDCRNSWQATGCTTRNPTGLDPDQAWQRAKEALSNGAGATTQYAYWTKKQSPKQQTGEEQQSQQTGQLELWWRWEVQQGLGSPAMLVEPLLEQEQDAAKAAAVIAKIMTTIITSFSELQAAVAGMRKSQQELQHKLAAKQAVLEKVVQERNQQEQELFTKVAMLLNRKAERIQLLTEKVQEQERQLEHLRGMEEEPDTDDEARAMEAYALETEDEDDEERDQAMGQLGENMEHQQVQLQQLPGSLPAPLPSADGNAGAAMQVDSTAVLPAGPAGRGSGPVGLMDLDGATQPLGDAQLAALAPLQQQQLAASSIPASGQGLGAADDVGGGAANAAVGTEAGPAALVGGIDWAAIQQAAAQPDSPAHKPKAIRRRR